MTNEILIFQDGRRFFKMAPKTYLIGYIILANDQLELTFSHLCPIDEKTVERKKIPLCFVNFDVFYPKWPRIFVLDKVFLV